MLPINCIDYFTLNIMRFPDQFLVFETIFTHTFECTADKSQTTSNLHTITLGVN